MQVLTGAPAEGSGQSLQAAACADVSFVTSSVWVEATDSTGAPAEGALVLALRLVPTITAETWSSAEVYRRVAGPSLRTLPVPTAAQTAAPRPD